MLVQTTPMSLRIIVSAALEEVAPDALGARTAHCGGTWSPRPERGRRRTGDASNFGRPATVWRTDPANWAVAEYKQLKERGRPIL